MLSDRVRQRFEAKFTRGEADACWLWEASVNRGGYGQFQDGERMTNAHRVSYRLYRGEIPAGMRVLHSCDRPACVNPNHLRIGTAKENTAEMFARGRARPARGEAHPRSRLTEDLVREIRRRAAAGETRRAIAKSIGVGSATVTYVCQRHTWAHVA